MHIKIKGKEQLFTCETDLENINIGRASENDFVVPLDDFSRKHCILTVKGEYVFIKDLGSKNGVMIDGHRIPSNQQFPIYAHTIVLIANHFRLILPDGTTTIRPPDDEGSEIKLVMPKKDW